MHDKHASGQIYRSQLDDNAGYSLSVSFVLYPRVLSKQLDRLYLALARLLILLFSLVAHFGYCISNVRLLPSGTLSKTLDFTTPRRSSQCVINLVEHRCLHGR